mmetsp:Transcript_23672/g.79526  ORF Transcript_23672/g.79526 Transcript_23672/m.79526 type:complete len:295 (-) Transcript_23672:346-1230(-)
MSTACVFITSSHTRRPAARMVVPVSTRSTTASARPRPTAASTEPEMVLISVFTPLAASSGAKNWPVRLGKEVAMRPPAKSAAHLCFSCSGTWRESAHLPMPSSSSVRTVQPASATMSWPVIPRSTLPMPTNEAMSLAGRNTKVMGRLLHGATSRRSLRWYLRPAASTNFMHSSARRPFLGRASSMLPSPPALPAATLSGGTTLMDRGPVERPGALPLPSSPGAPSSRKRSAAALAWPSSPSSLARRCASRTRPSAVVAWVRWSQVRTRRKVKTLRPPVDRAVPPVGRVWLGPAP